MSDGASDVIAKEAGMRQGKHMRVDMRQSNSHAFGNSNLRFNFSAHVVHTGLVLKLGKVAVKIAGSIDQSTGCTLRRYRAPTVFLPFASHRDVDAGVKIR